MPRWGEHLYIASKIYIKIKDIIKMDKNLFLFGNILPDVQDGYLVKDISNIVSHQINHYDFDNNKNVYENFYNLYSKQLNNSLILGYFTHLTTDYLWNKKFKEKCIIDNKNYFVGYYGVENKIVKKEEKEAILDKQNDFRIFENYIYNKFNIESPTYEEKLVANSNLIETVNIKDKDIINVLDFINETKNNAEFNENLKIFQLEELEKYIDVSVKNIIKYYKELKILEI